MIFYIIFFFKKHIYGFNIYYMIKYLCNSIPGEKYKKIFKKNIVGGKNCVLRTKLCFLDEYSIFFNKSYI